MTKNAPIREVLPTDITMLTEPEVLDVCQEAADLNAAIAEPNENVALIKTLSEPFQEPARRGVGREQAEPFSALVTVFYEGQIPYETAGLLDVQLDHEQKDLFAQRQRAEIGFAAAAAAIDEQVALAIDIAPLGEHEYASVAEQEKEKAHQQSLGAIEAADIAAKGRRETIDAFFGLAGEAWSVPRGLNGEERQRLVSMARQAVIERARQGDRTRTSHDRLAEWKEMFRQEVEAVVVQLAEQELISDKPLPISLIHNLTQSSKLGTDTSLRRMVKSGLMERSDAEMGEMKAWEIVASMLLNANPTTLALKRSRAQSAGVEIIKEVVDTHLAKVKQAQAKKSKPKTTS